MGAGVRDGDGMLGPLLILLIIAALAIFGIACVYASWEEKIDRRKQQHEANRQAWKEVMGDWRLPPTPARGRELAG